MPSGVLRGRVPGLAALSIMLAVPWLFPAAWGDGAADPAGVLEKMRERLKAQEQQQEREFKQLLENARVLLAQHAYDQAKRVLAQAARMRPNDDACARLLAQAEAGTPAAAGAEKLLDGIREDQNAKNAMLHVQLGASLFEAEKAMKAGDHARALEHAERVLDSVGYVTDAGRAAKLRAQAEAVLASARAAGDAAKAAELRNVLGAHKERAAQDKVGTLDALNKRGWQQVDQGDAEKALATAEEMIRLEPGSSRGIFLRQRARGVVDGKGDVAALKAKRQDAEKKLLVDQLDEEMQVGKDAKAKIILPGKRHPGDYVARDERPVEAWEQQYRAKLREPIEVELRNATIAEACRYLSQAAECAMVLDPAVAKDPKRMTLPKMTMSLEHALRWVCRFGKASYALRDHAILVTTRGGLLDEPLSRDYDVSSLLIPTRCIRTTFNGGSMADEQSWGGREVVGSARQGGRDDETKPVAEDAMGETWVRFIRNTIAPETWDEAGRDGAVQQARQPFTINYRNGRIVVVHAPEVHEQIDRLLNDFRRARNLQVHIFARFLVIQTDFLEKYNLDMGSATPDLTLGTGTLTPAEVGDTYGFVSEPADPWQTGVTPPRRSLIGYMDNDSRVSTGGEGELTTDGPLGFNWSHFGSDRVNVLLEAVLKRRKGTILSAPRLTCFNTQRANFQAVTNYNYVRAVSTDGEPEIGNVPDGIIFDVQPFVSSDRRYITLVLQPQMRTLLNRATLQTGGMTYASGPFLQRSVNLPDTELRSVATTVTVPDGGTMLVGGLSTVRQRSGEANVPIINRIPLLRYLFREWSQFDSRQSLIVLVTAEIVPDIFEE